MILTLKPIGDKYKIMPEGTSDADAFCLDIEEDENFYKWCKIAIVVKEELIEGFQTLDELFKYAHNMIYDENIIKEHPGYIEMFEQNIRDIVESESFPPDYADAE